MTPQQASEEKSRCQRDGLCTRRDDARDSAVLRDFIFGMREFRREGNNEICVDVATDAQNQ